MQEGIGSCTADDIAGSLLARVISSYPNRQPHPQLLLDAGGAALSKDRGTGEGETWGRIVGGLDGKGEGKGEGKQAKLVIKSVSQECAVVDVVGGGEIPKVGDCVRILPIHSCMTAMQHPVLYAWSKDDQVVGELVPAKFWDWK